MAADTAGQGVFLGHPAQGLAGQRADVRAAREAGGVCGSQLHANGCRCAGAHRAVAVLDGAVFKQRHLKGLADGRVGVERDVVVGNDKTPVGRTAHQSVGDVGPTGVCPQVFPIRRQRRKRYPGIGQRHVGVGSVGAAKHHQAVGAEVDLGVVHTRHRKADAHRHGTRYQVVAGQPGCGAHRVPGVGGGGHAVGLCGRLGAQAGPGHQQQPACAILPAPGQAQAVQQKQQCGHGRRWVLNLHGACPLDRAVPRTEGQ